MRFYGSPCPQTYQSAHAVFSHHDCHHSRVNRWEPIGLYYHRGKTFPFHPRIRSFYPNGARRAPVRIDNNLLLLLQGENHFYTGPDAGGKDQGLTSEKRVVETNLRLLQAQIEPHFLFNTLSNILSLLDTDSNKGRSMLMDLIRYLRTSLTKTRGDTTTLGQEMGMIRAYLNIFKVRMEGRLRYRIDVPDSIKDLPFPPMLVQPLVENAIKHGIEPKIDGGEVTIRARKDGDVIRLELADTGTGLHEDCDMGFGLSNVRERLQSLYGDRGRLILGENRPSGLKAIIEVPHGTDQGDHRR